MTRSERREMRAGIIFISPWLVGMGVFLRSVPELVPAVRKERYQPSQAGLTGP